VTGAQLVVDQQFSAGIELIDAVRPQCDRQTADLIRFLGFGQMHREAGAQFLLLQ
jgi:hypothetical protein